MGELKDYLDLQNAVRADAALVKLINEYEDSCAALTKLLSDPACDGGEAIRLMNDIEYMSAEIETNPTYQSYVIARERYEAAVAARVKHTGMPGCNCSMCQEREKSKRRKYGEES